VVHSYAATALERFLALREGGRPKLAAADVAPHAQRLLEALFAAFKHPERCVRACGGVAVWWLGRAGCWIKPLSTPHLQLTSHKNKLSSHHPTPL
jgi:hypothetical protein